MGHTWKNLSNLIKWFTITLRKNVLHFVKRVTLLEKRREPTQTQPTYGGGAENRTRATVVGGERSHHYTIPESHLQKCATLEELGQT